MIHRLVQFAIRNRFLVFMLTLLLIVAGVISFQQMPVDAYPDLSPPMVEIITQWPGRAGEEVEQQVTIPIEVQMAGIPYLTNIRSLSEFGLSVVTMIFDDASVNDWNRQKVLERLTAVTLPSGLQPNIGPDYSPVGQLYWYTLRSTNPTQPDDLVEIYNELFPEQPTTEHEAKEDPSALVKKIVAHIDRGLEVEEILDLRYVILPKHRRVWFDEEEGLIHYDEEIEPVSQAD